MTFLSTFQKHLAKMILIWSLKLLLAPECNIPLEILNMWKFLFYLVYSYLRYWSLTVLEMTIKLSKITICSVITALPSNVQSSFKGLCVCDTDLGEMLQLSVLVVKLDFFSKEMNNILFKVHIHFLMDLWTGCLLISFWRAPYLINPVQSLQHVCNLILFLLQLTPLPVLLTVVTFAWVRNALREIWCLRHYFHY